MDLKPCCVCDGSGIIGVTSGGDEAQCSACGLMGVELPNTWGGVVDWINQSSATREGRRVKASGVVLALQAIGRAGDAREVGQVFGLEVCR